jgi:adenylate cyclase
MTRLRLILLSLYVVFGITVTWQWLHYRLQDPNEKVERDPAPIAFVQNWWLRKKLRASLTTKPPSRSVVIVSCGWRARKIYGPLPWPRDFFATLIEKLRASGVKTIVMDPIFADPNLQFLSPAAFQSLFPDLPLASIKVVNPHNYVKELAYRLREARKQIEQTHEGTKEQLEIRLSAFDKQRKNLLTLARGIARGDASRAFERVVAKRRDIVFPTDYSSQPKFAASKLGAKLIVAHALAPFDGQAGVKRYDKLLTLYPRLLLTNPLIGVNEIDPWQPHFIAHARLLVAHEKQVYPSTIVRGVAHFLGSNIAVEKNAEGLLLGIGKKRVQLDPEGRFPLYYYNEKLEKEPFTRVSAIQLLRGKVARHELAGKLAIIDIRTPSLKNVLEFPTPLHAATWASELKATLASNLLLAHRGPTADPATPLWLWVAEGVFILLLGLGFAWLGIRGSFALSIGMGVVVVLVLLATDWWLGISAALIMVALIFAFAVLAFLFTTIGLQYERQHSARKKVRSAFGHYLPEKVLEHMLREKDALVLGGKRRNLSILFSDIRGFTSVSERSTPEALGEALNVHLTALTDAVFDHHGTLDKYMGDCVMAFFGAPISREQHALDAVKAAIAMQERLAGIQDVWQKHCKSSVAIGVGVASGDVIVGNMGSVKLFDYTVIGDNVNLASRLEGLTKVYGVEVLVSDQTRDMTADDVTYLEVDRVRVKGKSEPVSIFEAVCIGRADDARMAYNVDCEAGVTAFRSQKWDAAQDAFAEAAKKRPDANLPTLYLERIATLREAELPSDWDGVTEFTHK